MMVLDLIPSRNTIVNPTNKADVNLPYQKSQLSTFVFKWNDTSIFLCYHICKEN